MYLDLFWKQVFSYTKIKFEALLAPNNFLIEDQGTFLWHCLIRGRQGVLKGTVHEGLCIFHPKIHCNTQHNDT
jgi:hypothetical protein